MRSSFCLIFGLLALGALALWVGRILYPGAEPPPRLVQDMAQRPLPPRFAAMPAGAVPFAADDSLPSESSGEALFLLHCAACHGADGSGRSFVAQQPGMPDVSDLTSTASSPDELFRTLSQGRGAMPAFASRLSEAKRRLLIPYITTLHRP